MKPEELLDPDTLPDDLRWLSSDFKLNPKDPVFALIAWHWHRVQKAEDSLRAANLDLQRTVDERVATIAGAVTAAAELGEKLAQVLAALQQRPALISAQLEDELKAPLTKVGEIEKSLSTILKAAQGFRENTLRIRILAALLVGVALGTLSALIVLLP